MNADGPIFPEQVQMTKAQRIAEVELELWLVVEALFDDVLSDNGAYAFSQALKNRDAKIRQIESEEEA